MKTEKIIENIIYYLIIVTLTIYWIIFINCFMFIISFIYCLIKSMIIEYKAIKTAAGPDLMLLDNSDTESNLISISEYRQRKQAL